MTDINEKQRRIHLIADQGIISPTNSTGHVRFYMDGTFSAPQQGMFADIQVVNMVIPHTWYNIDEYSDTLYLYFDNGSVTETYTITLNRRNYTADQFATRLQSDIRTAASGDSVLQSCTVTYNENFNYFAFDAGESVNYFGFLNGVNTPYDLMGIQNDAVDSVADVGTSQTFSSSDCVDMNVRSHMIFVYTNLPIDHYMPRDADADGLLVPRNVLIECGIDSAFGGFNSYEPEVTSNIVDNLDIKEIIIELRDTKGNILNTRGGNWTIVLAVNWRIKGKDKNQYENPATNQSMLQGIHTQDIGQKRQRLFPEHGLNL